MESTTTFLPPASRTTMSGPLAAVDDHLLVEVDVRRHPGQLDHPAQLQLAPAAARLRPSQRGDQGLGLLAELLGAAPGELHLLGELGVRPGPRDVGVAQLLLDPGEGLPHRPDQRLDVEPLRELALGERGLLGRRPLEQRGPLLRRAGALLRRRRGGAEAIACQQVSEHRADRNAGQQGEDDHMF